jgi:Ca2+-binding EF-hand superfamily protein
VPKIDNQLILYVDLLDLITSVGNKNHNPFKSLVRKLDFFLESNKISVLELMEMLDPLKGKTDGVALDKFAQFLKDKVEKGKDVINLESYARLMDIDKDGRITAEDL